MISIISNEYYYMSRIRELRERQLKCCTLRCVEFEDENRSRFFSHSLDY